MSTKVCIYSILNSETKNLEKWAEAVSSADLLVLVSVIGGHKNRYGFPGGYSSIEEREKVFSDDKTINEKTISTIKNYLQEKSIVVINESHYQCYGYMDFSGAKNHAVMCASSTIQENLVDHDDWVMMSIDLDEFIEDGEIQRLRENWNPSMDNCTMTGITKNEGEQIVSHKIHGYQKVTWKGVVHEELNFDNKSKNEIKTLDLRIRYEHIQDKTKKRDYYNLLKNQNEKFPNNPRTLVYLAWEADLHGEHLNSVEYSSNTIRASESNYRNDRDIAECRLQAMFNIAMDNVSKLIRIKFLKEAVKLIDEYKSFPPIRKAYVLLADAVWDDNDLESKELSIFYYKKALDIKFRPFCWVDDDLYYNDSYIYSKLSNAYFYEEKNIETSSLSVDYAKMSYDIEPTELHKQNLDFCLQQLQMMNNDKEIVEDMNIKNVNKICVYAICKNESQFIDAWMESMKEADYIVVMDTGSTDDTELKFNEWKEKLPVNKFFFFKEEINPWRFDVARNEGMKLIPSDANILMSTDLDELLEPGWADVLRENWIDGVHERAIYKYSWSHMEDGTDGRVFQYDKIHSRNWIWKYPVHELLWNTVTDTNLYDSMNTLVIFDQIHLHHYPDRSKSRKSYLPLLELRASENRDDYYGLIYLAHEYFYQSYYEKSIETLKYVLENFSDRYNDIERASCYLFMGDSNRELKNYKESKDNYLSAIEIDKTYREPYLNLASVLIDEGEYNLAIVYIKEGLRNSYRHFTWVERDISWTYEPYDLLSIACFYKGNKKDSLAYATKAYSYDNSDERLRNNIELILRNTSDLELI